MSLKILGNVGFLALALFVSHWHIGLVAAQPDAADAEGAIFKFDFGPGEVAPGCIQVVPATLYSDARDYGFENGSAVTAVDRGGDDPLRSDFCTSDKPCFFSVKLPEEGNYRVTVTLGDRADETTATIKAELRRLMLEQVHTAAGEFVTRSFIVNTRTPRIRAVDDIKAGEVRLKAPRETTQEARAWDDRLTLEFNNTRPAVCALEIAPVDVPTLYLLGDSTVCDQLREPYNSWGQMLPRFFSPGVAVANHGESGETYRDSIGRRRLDKVLSLMKPGDYLFMQFGHNDQKQRGEGMGAFLNYTAEMKRHIAAVRKRGGTPVLITPMNRRTFDAAGNVTNSLGNYPEAVRQVAKEEDVALIDLYAASKTLYEAWGPENSKRAFVDNTHHNNYGSYELARCIVEGIRQNKLDIARFLIDDVPPFDPSHPDSVDDFKVPPSPLPGGSTSDSQAGESRITVHADQIVHRLTPNLTGACLEDVNHEVYGGIDSQMIFGEHFQEPPRAMAPQGFTAYGGVWRVDSGELVVEGGDGPKLVGDFPPFSEGEAGVDIFFADRSAGNAEMLLKVSRPGIGVDDFDGFEVALDAQRQALILGRHRQDFTKLCEVPCPVPTGEWIPLIVRLQGSSVDVRVAGKRVILYEDEQPLGAGTVALRPWQRSVRYRDVWVKTAGQTRQLPLVSAADPSGEVSGVWRPVNRGDASGAFALVKERPYIGRQSQRITLTSGQGEIGIENQGLNRWGMHFEKDKPYEGILVARAAKTAELVVVLESRDGTRRYAEAKLLVAGGDWQHLDFELVPSASDPRGRLAILLRQPGSVDLGYALLQPGEWGRFKGLPVRRDVAKGLIDQGITVLRYGGSMINAAEYRWKKMIGPRDQRYPYKGWWYPYASNGWGIVDFMNYCEAAGFEYIPAFNMDETPSDMADFIEYARGAADSEWGRRRGAEGHPAPYKMKYLELGNEERVDEQYFAKFKPLAEAIWARDPEITLVVGDFQYRKPIDDPFNFEGAASGITALTAHKRILQLARENDREVWFDLHINTDGPRPDSSLEGTLSFVNALEELVPGARTSVVVFELNAGNHGQRRALANALAIGAFQRDGRIPIATSANCLQPDGQNDNGWDQGLLFLDPSQVWLQPPGYVTRMISRNAQPLLVKTEQQESRNDLDVTATRSEDGRRLVMQVVNASDRSVPAQIDLAGFGPASLEIRELAGPPDAVNTAMTPKSIAPRTVIHNEAVTDGNIEYALFPHSFTIINFTTSTTASARQIVPVPIQQVRIDDEFWSPTRKVWRTVTIPDCLDKFEKDGAIKNFEKVRDHTGAGTHGGPPWEDGLLYEMIRGCADFLAEERDPELEKRLDGYVEVVAAASAGDPDGYVNTWTQLKEPEHRWGLAGGNDVHQHDVYSAGAMVEAAVHYYRATGKTALLRVATRLANHMCDLIGPAPRKNVIPGHSLTEEALVELYQLYREEPALKEKVGIHVVEDRYLALARFFIEARGHYEDRASFKAYGQDHKPVFEQDSIEGHAVRATLMGTGVAAIAAATRLWNNMSGRRLYITGGAGATRDGEAFGQDYVLPNDGYLETCAAIGGAFFSYQMSLIEPRARYVDELETVLYNGALCGVSLAGDTYAYVNPLSYKRGRHERLSWHDCPCCPPMFLKIMGALPGYIYGHDRVGLYVNLYVGSRVDLTQGGSRVSVRQTTRYPWEGTVRLSLEPESPATFDLNLRVPGWCRRDVSADDLYQPRDVPAADAFEVEVNGQAVTPVVIRNGYARLHRTWRKGDRVDVTMTMPIQRIEANPAVQACAGRVALRRGPVVYAIETGSGELTAKDVLLPSGANLTAIYRPDLLGGVCVIRGDFRGRSGDASNQRRIDLEAIPYFAYGNRGPCDLCVWLPESDKRRTAK